MDDVIVPNIAVAAALMLWWWPTQKLRAFRPRKPWPLWVDPRDAAAPLTRMIVDNSWLQLWMSGGPLPKEDDLQVLMSVAVTALMRHDFELYELEMRARGLVVAERAKDVAAALVKLSEQPQSPADNDALGIVRAHWNNPGARRMRITCVHSRRVEAGRSADADADTDSLAAGGWAVARSVFTRKSGHITHSEAPVIKDTPDAAWLQFWVIRCNTYESPIRLTFVYDVSLKRWAPMAIAVRRCPGEAMPLPLL